MISVRGLARRMTGSAGVLILSTALTNVLRIVNTMVLSRLLSPKDFGLAGIIMSIFFLITMLTDAGFQAFVVRHEHGEDHSFLDSVWTAHVGRGGLICLLVFVFAGPAGLIIGKPELIPLLAGASLFFLFDGLVSTSIYAALRQNRVRTLSAIDFIAFIFQFVAGIVAALILRNAWAMIIALVSGSAARAFLSYVMLPASSRRIRYDRTVLKELWTFSRVVGASSMLTIVISQFDKVVLGRLLTLEQFGIYSIANNLSNAPVATASMYTSRIVYPAAAKVGREWPEGIRQTIYGGRGFVFYGYLFAAGGLIGGAELLVRILYDPRYLAAGLFLRILAIMTAMTMLTRSMDAILVAIGETEQTLKMNIARILWLAVGSMAGLVWYGPIGLVFALGVIEIPAYCYAALVMRRRDILDAGRELLAFATIGAGMILGWGTDAGARMMLSL